jgi:hypothetical protein
MPRKSSKRLVIDASAATSTGELNSKGVSCRAFFDEIFNSKHRVVFTLELEDEWRRHSHPFARKWQAQMARAGRVVNVTLVRNEHLQRYVMQKAPSEKQQDEMLKDCHLIEAACATDQTVISLDEIARKFFRSAVLKLRELKNIVWVNPTIENEKPLIWLRQGAKLEIPRRLGFAAKTDKD